MKINRITITGADDNTPILQLEKLSKEFPFVEWGILYSQSRAGTNRYPSSKWRSRLRYWKELNFSAHLCGQYPRDILQQGKYFQDAYDSLEGYGRVQINFNFKNTTFDPEHLLTLLKRTDVRYILQANKSNAEVIDTIDAENFDVLYDSSGGRGTVIKEIKEPFSNHYTGYSGGLTPENIDDFCQQIIAHPSDSSVFIDCESGVRNEKDEFDLNKVHDYLAICKKYVTI